MFYLYIRTNLFKNRCSMQNETFLIPWSLLFPAKIKSSVIGSVRTSQYWNCKGQ